MSKTPNKPVVLRVFWSGIVSGDERMNETFHKTASSAHERLADILRRADRTYSRYEIHALTEKDVTRPAKSISRVHRNCLTRVCIDPEDRE